MPRKWGAAIALIAILFAVAYFGSPYLAARNFKEAALTADADKLDEIVDFPAVRESLKSQLSSAMMSKFQNDPELKNNPFAGLGLMIAPTIVEKAVNAFVTPEGISAMVRGQNPNEVKDTKLNPKLHVGYEWVSLDRFRVNLTTADDAASGPTLLFERRGLFSWKLIRFNIPSSILEGNKTTTATAAQVEVPARAVKSTTEEITPEPSPSMASADEDGDSIEDLKRRELALNEECRGGSGGNTEAICNARDALMSRIEAKGVCWAYSDIDIPSSEYDWHPCGQRRPR
jgi:hypothetical protein